MQKNGIEHITAAPYHASSNGCAEHAVQTFKSMMKKAGDGNLNTKVSRCYIRVHGIWVIIVVLRKFVLKMIYFARCILC